MRSVVMLIVVLVVLVGGFALFMLTQGTTKEYKVQQITSPTTLPRPVPATQGDVKLGAGNEVWIQGFNKKTGELTNEFRADRYDPPVGNRVHVIHPDSRFYENNGQVMTVTAEYGDMVMAEGARKPGQIEAISNQPPQNGVLHNVTLGLLENAEATVPILTAKLPILAFDNDTLRMNTIDWKNGDVLVPADQVPVTVRGRDYDFDGQGLVLRYNQRDQRLEFLQVAHGKRLLIKNTQAFAPGSTTQPDETSMLPLQMGDRPIELVDADPAAAPKLSAEERERHRLKREAAARAATQPAPPSRRKGRRPSTTTTKPASSKPAREPVAYRAHFEDNVIVKEGPTQIGQADAMFTTFMSGQAKSGTQPTSAPATEPSTGLPMTSGVQSPGMIPVPSLPAAAPAALSATPVRAGASPAAPRAHRNAAHPPTTAPTRAALAPAGAASQPNQPIEITWTGKLTVQPEPLAKAGLISSTDRIIEFVGRPAHLDRQGASVDAPYVWAGVEGDRFKAIGNDQFPQITLKNADGSSLITHAVDSDGEDVVITGKSVAESMIAQADGTSQKVITHWTDVANLHLITADNGSKAIDQATFKGNVDVQHPQLHLNGDALAMGFVPEAGKDQPTLKTVHVDGHVNAAITGDDGTVQTIRSRVLDLATATQDDGSLSIRQMHANGDVIAQDPNQTLKTDDLVAQLSPNAIAQDDQSVNKINIDHMTAAGNVRFNTADGNAAVADTLKIDRENDVQLITLVGTPASVTNNQSKVTGNFIKLDSTGDHAAVSGPGMLDSVAQQQGAKSAQPINIAWAKSMDYDGKNNRATILGDVVIRSRASDGAFDKATGQVLDVTLADAPTTQPAEPSATQEAKATPTTAPAAGLAMSSAKKTIKELTLSNPTPTNDGVEVSSLAYDPNDANKLIKRTHLFAPRVIVQTNPDGTLGAMTVPSAGRMLYEDRSGPTTQPATQPSTQPAGAKGSMAMEWKKRLVYDPAEHRALLEGDVVVVHEAPGQDMMRMLAPRLIAELDNGPGGDSQIKQVVADQGATMLNKSVRIDAPRATYQPQNDRIIAEGTQRQPVEFFQEGGLSSGSISELWWNLKTNSPERMINVSAHVNRVAPPSDNP